MRLAFVTPRYGIDVIGGAEQGARLLAEHVVRRRGWAVEVFTSDALDMATWASHFPTGTTVERGVTVHRFPSVGERHRDFDRLSDTVLGAPSQASRALQEQWIEWQGPNCAAAVDAAEASAADVVAFYPYLYLPTVIGVPRLGPRAVMHPAAHDEPPLRLPIFDDVFALAGGLVLQTEAERRLVARRFPATAAVPQVLVGLGVDDPPPADATPAALAHELTGGRPYLLCLGRVDAGKGTTLLAELFQAYKRRRPGDLALVFAGPVVHRPPRHPDVVVTGMVDDATKWALLRNAAAVVSPSAHEAFSIVVLEGWIGGAPLLVNARCGPTREHCERSGGGLWFDDYGSFEVAVDRLLGDGELAATLVERGRRYVEADFTWPAVIDRYTGFLEHVADRRRRRLAQRAGYARRRMDAAPDPEALARLVAAKAQASRDAGDYPHGLEEELDAHWHRVAGRPEVASPEQLMASVARVRETAAAIALPPADASSKVPGGRQVHELINRSVHRQLGEVVDQLGAFARSVAECVEAIAGFVGGPLTHTHPEVLGQLEAMEGRLAALIKATNAGPREPDGGTGAGSDRPLDR